MKVPRTIHDFYGFPKELFDVEYPAPGEPEVAQRIVDLVEPTYVGLDEDSWASTRYLVGPGAHVPQADVPVLHSRSTPSYPSSTTSISALNCTSCGPGRAHPRERQRRAHLRLIDWRQPGQGTDWAHRFDDDVRSIMTSDPSQLAFERELAGLPVSAVPTPDHFPAARLHRGPLGRASSHQHGPS